MDFVCTVSVRIAHFGGQGGADFGFTADLDCTLLVGRWCRRLWVRIRLRAGRGILHSGGRTAAHAFCCAFAVGVFGFDGNGLAFFGFCQGVAGTNADFFAICQPAVGDCAHAVFVSKGAAHTECLADFGFATDSQVAAWRMVLRRRLRRDGGCAITNGCGCVAIDAFLVSKEIGIFDMDADVFAFVARRDGIG